LNPTDKSNSLTTNNPYELNNLVDHGEMILNLKEMDMTNSFDRYYRVRVENMKVLLLDENKKPIQSMGTDTGERIVIDIEFPTIYKDTDPQGNSVTFWAAKNLNCESEYYTTGIDADPVFTSHCKVNDKFKSNDYEASLDGDYHIKIRNPGDIDLRSIKYVKVEFDTSLIKLETDRIGGSDPWITDAPQTNFVTILSVLTVCCLTVASLLVYTKSKSRRSPDNFLPEEQEMIEMEDSDICESECNMEKVQLTSPEKTDIEACY